MFWTLVLTLSTLFVYFVLIKPLTYWKKKNVASYSVYQTWKDVYLAIMGRRTITEMIKTSNKDFSGHRYCGGYQFTKPMLIIRDPELIKQITVKDFDHFVDHTQFTTADTDLLTQRNLIALKGDRWRHMRATLSPSFTGSKMKMMFGLMSDCANQFVKYFSDQNKNLLELDMKDVFTRFTNDVIASTAFGVSCDSLRDRENDFYIMGKKTIALGTSFSQILKVILSLVFPKLMKVLGLSLETKEVSDFFRNVIKQNIQEREKHNIVRMDMIHLLMEARKDKTKINENEDEEHLNKQITDDDITAQAMIFFFAGFEVVATAMSFMSFELAIHPDIQERLQAEIDDTLNECNGTVTYEALNKMKYMDMVVSEALRKWPPVLALDRVCVKPYTIQPINSNETAVDLKPGDTVLTGVMGLHWNPEYFPEPNRFDPERFSEENKNNIHPYVYLPFGSGPRNCIGNRFALMEIKLVFFYLLSKFNITVVEKTVVPLRLSKQIVSLVPEGGFSLGLKPRILPK